jgi:hypothetical protein
MLQIFGKRKWVSLDTTLLTKGIHNISSYSLSPSELSLFTLGPSFIPSQNFNLNMFNTSLQSWIRQIRLSCFFKNSPKFTSKYYLPNPNYKPPLATPIIENAISTTTSLILKSVTHKNRVRHNVAKNFFKVVKSLISNNNISIRLADKNLGFVVLDSSHYRQLVLDHLEDTSVYKSLSPPDNLLSNFGIFIKAMFPSEPKLVTYLLSKTATSCKFYCLIKIHKSPIAGRPIASAANYYTSPLSIWLSDQLKVVNENSSTILRNSFQLVTELSTTSVPTNCLLVTFDVQALYPSIPIEFALERISPFIYNTFDTTMARKVITCLRYVLTHHYVQYNKQTYKQIQGTAMGTSCAVEFANLFMMSLELTLINQFQEHLLIYKRYIDDGFIIWNSSPDLLLTFLNGFHAMCPSIIITHEASLNSINYLDLTIYKGSNFVMSKLLDTKVFSKSLNLYLYIPYKSEHPLHSKKSFIRAELIRFVRLSSTEDSFLQTKRIFYQNLLARGYPPLFLNQIFSLITFQDRFKFLNPKRTKTLLNKFLFITRYCSATKHISFSRLLNLQDHSDQLLPPYALKRTLVANTVGPNLNLTLHTTA